MAENFADHFALRDDGDEAQRPALAPGTGSHLQVKHPLEQPCPAPARRRGTCRRLVEALLPWRREDRAAQMAVRREAPPIAHEMHMRQGHERRELLQEFQRCEANAGSAVRPRMREGVDKITVGIFVEAL